MSAITSVFNDGVFAEQFERYRHDPASVDETWRQYFRIAESLFAGTRRPPRAPLVLRRPRRRPPPWTGVADEGGRRRFAAAGHSHVRPLRRPARSARIAAAGADELNRPSSTGSPRPISSRSRGRARRRPLRHGEGCDRSQAQRVLPQRRLRSVAPRSERGAQLVPARLPRRHHHAPAHRRREEAGAHAPQRSRRPRALPRPRLRGLQALLGRRHRHAGADARRR
jgi:hypothetical protein